MRNRLLMAQLSLGVICALFSAPLQQAKGRIVQEFDWKKGYANSDVVVIARPISSKETKETLTHNGRVYARAVVTTFEMVLVLKGQDLVKAGATERDELKVRHYKSEGDEGALARKVTTFVGGFRKRMRMVATFPTCCS